MGRIRAMANSDTHDSGLINTATKKPWFLIMVHNVEHEANERAK